MKNEKNTIILLCIIIIILLAGIAAFASLNRENCNLSIKNNVVTQGESLVIELTDSKGIPIQNEKISVKITGNDEKGVDKEFTTSKEGNVYFNISDLGEYDIECEFSGNLKYSPKSLSQKVNVENPKTEVISEEKTNNYDSVSGLSEDGYSYYPQYGPPVDHVGTTREFAIANNWHYIPMTIDGKDCGAYTPYDSNAKCYHT